MNVKNRTIFSNDNLPVLQGIDTESIDLIYLDPPFNSNRNYAAPIGSDAAGAAFKDTWTLSDVDNAWHGEIADRQPRFVSGNTRSRTHTRQRHEVLPHYDGGAVVRDEACPQKDGEHISAL